MSWLVQISKSPSEKTLEDPWGFTSQLMILAITNQKKIVDDDSHNNQPVDDDFPHHVHPLKNNGLPTKSPPLRLSTSPPLRLSAHLPGTGSS